MENQLELEFGERMANFPSDTAPELKRAISNLKVLHECTTADIPGQNRKVERINRTIVTKARSMLTRPSVPKYLWAEAMGIACYLRNLTPSVDKHISPHEI